MCKALCPAHLRFQSIAILADHVRVNPSFRRTSKLDNISNFRCKKGKNDNSCYFSTKRISCLFFLVIGFSYTHTSVLCSTAVTGVSNPTHRILYVYVFKSQTYQVVRSHKYAHTHTHTHKQTNTNTHSGQVTHIRCFLCDTYITMSLKHATLRHRMYTPLGHTNQVVLTQVFNTTHAILRLIKNIQHCTAYLHE